MLVTKHFEIQSSFLTNENIPIKCKGEIMTDTTKLEDIFNTHYINIVEKSSCTPPNTKGNPEKPLKGSSTIKNLLKK